MAAPNLQGRLVEWVVSHSLWEFAKFVIGGWVISYAGSRQMHAAIGTAPNLFLFVLGIGLILSSIGVLSSAKSRAVASFRTDLRRRCAGLIIEWQKLAELYQNALKADGDPKTLQEPMSPAWASSESRFWPYKIGNLQGQTNALRNELAAAGVVLDVWDARISLPEILEALRTYRELV